MVARLCAFKSDFFVRLYYHGLFSVTFKIQCSIVCSAQLIDGTRVFQEIHCNSGGPPDRNSRGGSEDVARSGPEMPPPGHHDAISDMLMCRTSKQTFVVSSSRDGVVKLWK